VTGIVHQEDVDVEVVVRMQQNHGTWIAYDVVFDGLSLMEDYRHQFTTFLRKKSVDALIARLSERAAEREGRNRDS
jgi:phospholipid transport system substrate-binding protein